MASFGHELVDLVDGARPILPCKMSGSAATNLINNQIAEGITKKKPNTTYAQKHVAGALGLHCDFTCLSLFLRMLCLGLNLP